MEKLSQLLSPLGMSAPQPGVASGAVGIAVWAGRGGGWLCSRPERSLLNIAGKDRRMAERRYGIVRGVYEHPGGHSQPGVSVKGIGNSGRGCFRGCLLSAQSLASSGHPLV